jgi:hypothetical protein
LPEVSVSDQPRTYDNENGFYLDENDLEDRLGRVQQQIIGDELVLTRISEREVGGPFEVLRFDRTKHLLRIFPRSTAHGALVPQFDRITEIQIESPRWDSSYHSAEHGQYYLLYARGLPKGFSAIYEFGLGINRDYRDLVDGIELRTKCSVVRFVTNGPEGLDPSGAVFSVSLTRFADYRAAVDRSRSRGRTATRRVIDADAHNAIADLFGLKPIEPKYTRNPVIRAITEEVATGHVTDTSERALLADEVTVAAPTIGREAPERLMRLREDIELVSLNTLIEQFEKDLQGPYSRDEDHWQTFFNNNRFALQLVFSTPIVVERQHATVQAGDIDGRGSRITDFLCANAVTRTIVIVEIKTPGAVLMNASPYRGKGTDAAVYSPHSDLVGPVAQIQSQMASVPRSLAPRLTPHLELDPWNDPRGAVITGQIASLNENQRDSFLRYRAAMSNVTVLGYDEVLERLKSLKSMLDSPPTFDADTLDAEH